MFGWRQATFAPSQDTEVEVRFEPVGEETRVTVEHTGWDSVPAAHVARHGFPDALFLTRHGEWWQTLLASYKDGVWRAADERGGEDEAGGSRRSRRPAPRPGGSAAFGFIFATAVMNALSFGLMIPVLPT